MKRLKVCSFSHFFVVFLFFCFFFLEMLSFTSHRSGSVALVAAKMGIPDKFSAMVSPGEPGPVVHAALLISQWGSVQSALCLFSYFPSLSPPSLSPTPSLPLPSPSCPSLWTGLAAHEHNHLGFSIIAASCWLLCLTSGCILVAVSWGVWLPVCVLIQGRKCCCHETLI